MSKRYGERGFGRYGDPDEDRTDVRGYEREAGRGYGEQERGYAAPRRGGEYGYGRDYYAGEYGSRHGARDYPRGEYGAGYGREGQAGAQRRRAGEYDHEYGMRSYGRDPVRGYGRAPEAEGVRDYETDYGRTTSRFYGRTGYEYGRDDYDDEREGARGEYGVRSRDRRNWLDRAADEVRSWFGGEDESEGVRRGETRGRGEGRFRGRGPKNYHRSDERVREEVCDRLTDNEWLDASDVEVSVVAGEVILSGTVDSRYAKRLAEQIAESVSCVANVQNNLRVQSYQPAGLDTTAPAVGTPDIIGTTGELPAPESGSGDTPPAGRPSSRAAGRS